jgi:hypothetical protein
MSSKSSAHTPLNQILDGGTGSNGIANNLLMMSKNSSDAYSSQQYQ